MMSFDNDDMEKGLFTFYKEQQSLSLHIQHQFILKEQPKNGKKNKDSSPSLNEKQPNQIKKMNEKCRNIKWHSLNQNVIQKSKKISKSKAKGENDIVIVKGKYLPIISFNSKKQEQLATKQNTTKGMKLNFALSELRRNKRALQNQKTSKYTNKSIYVQSNYVFHFPKIFKTRVLVRDQKIKKEKQSNVSHKSRSSNTISQLIKEEDLENLLIKQNSQNQMSTTTLFYIQNRTFVRQKQHEQQLIYNRASKKRSYWVISDKKQEKHSQEMRSVVTNNGIMQKIYTKLKQILGKTKSKTEVNEEGSTIFMNEQNKKYQQSKSKAGLLSMLEKLKHVSDV